MPYKNLGDKREYQARWCRENRLAAIEFLGGVCVVCGTTLNLEVDHKDPANKVSHRIWSWSKERRLGELEKCQVLCVAHHLDKTLRYANIEPTKIRKVHKPGCGCPGCENARALERAVAFNLKHPAVKRTIERARARGFSDAEIFAG